MPVHPVITQRTGDFPAAHGSITLVKDSPKQSLHRSNSSPPKFLQSMRVANASRVRTFVRFRDKSTKSCSTSQTWLQWRKARAGIQIAVTNPKQPMAESKQFYVDHVFTPLSSQEELFDAVGVASVDYFLAGYNGSIIAYGQSGSGKTHTMQGELAMESPERGLTVRVLDYLFNNLKEDTFSCSCAYVEIHNERIYDLLDGSSLEAKAIRESPTHQVYVQGMLEKRVSSANEAFDLLVAGNKARKLANRGSSKSHTVFTLKLTQRVGDDLSRTSVLHCVDLAGSEKQNALDFKSAKDVTQINKSLSSLANVIIALGDISTSGLKRHVPYRDCKLTFLLREALGGNSKTTVVATVATDEKWISETQSTLQFLERVKNVTTNAVRNEVIDQSEWIDVIQVEESTVSRSPNEGRISDHNVRLKVCSHREGNITPTSKKSKHRAFQEIQMEKVERQSNSESEGSEVDFTQDESSSVEAQPFEANGANLHLAAKLLANARISDDPPSTVFVDCGTNNNMKQPNSALTLTKDLNRLNDNVEHENLVKGLSVSVSVQTVTDEECIHVSRNDTKDMGTTTAGLKRDSWTQADEDDTEIEEPRCIQPSNERSEKSTGIVPTDRKLHQKDDETKSLVDSPMVFLAIGLCIGGCSASLFSYLRHKN